ncbi:GntR family transcriptional regulator [Promicromonospora sp. NPDC060204]|uniref:GntR family transcriptional regulator n=1 Tax=Promicromonospora sp. NPDC060204 TaxID=3347071 RepID=UPI00364C0E38
MTKEQRGKVDASAIYDGLRADIQDGTLRPGDPVREVAVAERFGVSRTPVREALSRLEHDRLLTSSSRGLVVRAVEADEVIQIYNVRILLEGETAAEAAQSRTEADLLRLESLLERDRSLQDPDDAARALTNIEFHEAIWTATHNPVLQDILRRLTVHLVRTPHSTLSVPGRWAEALDEHAALIDAVRRRDAGAARALASAHMTRAREIRLDLLRRHVVTALHTGPQHEEHTA